VEHRQWGKDNQAMKRLAASNFESDGNWEVAVKAFLLLPP
jgi:hypothetical protein